MVETSMAESDKIAMKETLRAQQQLLQKLYVELDQEREASATAASEAMDMILRLQGEKAAVKMEASHYKRMAEEKIGHAEATLEVFEELMYQKEMEIASLEFQVLAYKHKLLTFGCDFNVSEFDFPEDLILSRINDQLNGENGQSSTVRRLSSLPPPIQKNNLRTNQKRDRSPSPFSVPDVIPVTVEGSDKKIASFDSHRKSTDFVYGNLDSYWNQIQTLDKKVKVISDCKESGGEKCENLRSRRGRSCSIFSQATTKISSLANSDKENDYEDTHDREAIASPSCSVNVHDVFEVPQAREKDEVHEHGKKRLEKWISDVDNRLTKPDSVSEEIIESHVKHDMDRLKSMFGSGTHHEIKSCNAQAEFRKLHKRIDRIEKERISMRQEIRNEGDGEEHLRLLKDIQSQLNSIQSEMRREKTKSSSVKEDNISLAPLQEVIHIYYDALALSFEKSIFCCLQISLFFYSSCY